jgi:Flp pilus assembly pilin Flp
MAPRMPRIRRVGYSRAFVQPFIEAKGGNGMLDLILRRLRSEEGQTLVEYTLIVSLIAVICVAALSVTGTSVSDILNTISKDV